MMNLVMLTIRNSPDRTLRGEAGERSVGPELVVVKRWGDAGR
jgi:hypothetical protein